MTQANATYTVQKSTSNGRACLQGVVEVESSTGGWFAFSVFGSTPEQLQTSAYMQADLLSTDKGWSLDSLRAA